MIEWGLDSSCNRGRSVLISIGVFSRILHAFKSNRRAAAIKFYRGIDKSYNKMQIMSLGGNPSKFKSV